MKPEFNLDREVEALLEFPERAPSETLADYAFEQGWIGMRHRNWCYNFQQRAITEERYRRFLREISYYIFSAYLILRQEEPNK